MKEHEYIDLRNSNMTSSELVLHCDIESHPALWSPLLDSLEDEILIASRLLVAIAGIRDSKYGKDGCPYFCPLPRSTWVLNVRISSSLLDFASSASHLCRWEVCICNIKATCPQQSHSSSRTCGQLSRQRATNTFDKT
jgi:hypothetical protein